MSYLSSPLFLIVCVCAGMCVQCLQRPEEGIGSSGARVASDSKLLIMGPGDRTLVSAGSASALNCQAIFPTPLSCLMVKKKKIMQRIFLLQLYFVNYVYCSFVFITLNFLFCVPMGVEVCRPQHMYGDQRPTCLNEFSSSIM